ncbi:VOC family protein [Defluviimonas sp. D31]|uniref:VOC family protein n=1 Tax=Defluviimonas sp. D31 TaxID=3083253 RepID=UPI00296FC756|nr:VOC family protein [Defluviimonas sp. D31]MDW4551196.1 VOC family protein [Defluviimonas sp. D31]
MAKAKKGTPCWYELTTPDPDAAARFYAHVIGWSVADAGMEGVDYRIARAGGTMVAGMMAAPAGAPPGWIFYVTVSDCDKAAKALTKAGGTVHQAPADIPDTGRFAVAADPQGTPFGLLAPENGATSTAFDQRQTGHGCWHELMTSDPEAAMAFYGKQFGWKPGDVMDLGEMGGYHLFRHGKADIGGMMRQAPGMPGPDRPFWLPYFGTDSVSAAIGRVSGAGGRVFHGPHEVPGGAFIMVGQDPQGAMFALVGPK